MKWIMGILVLGLSLASGPVVHAATSMIENARVEQVYSVNRDPRLPGEGAARRPAYCYARLDKTVAYDGSEAVDCTSDSVLFDCGTTDGATRAFDLVLYALSVDQMIDVRVSDETKVGDSCLATHIYVNRSFSGCHTNPSDSSDQSGVASGDCEGDPNGDMDGDDSSSSS